MWDVLENPMMCYGVLFREHWLRIAKVRTAHFRVSRQKLCRNAARQKKLTMGHDRYNAPFTNSIPLCTDV